MNAARAFEKQRLLTRSGLCRLQLRRQAHYIRQAPVVVFARRVVLLASIARNLVARLRAPSRHFAGKPGQPRA